MACIAGTLFHAAPAPARLGEGSWLDLLSANSLGIIRYTISQFGRDGGHERSRCLAFAAMPVIPSGFVFVLAEAHRQFCQSFANPPRNERRDAVAPQMIGAAIRIRATDEFLRSSDILHDIRDSAGFADRSSMVEKPDAHFGIWDRWPEIPER